MDLVAELDAPCTPEVLFRWVRDLSLYPQWLEIIDSAEARLGGTERWWRVDLKARVGPLSRSKRLNMVRTAYLAPHLVVFERREDDGRTHSEWRLRAVVDDASGGHSHLTMTLHYGGKLWAPGLDRILRDEIRRSGERLLALIADGAKIATTDEIEVVGAEDAEQLAGPVERESGSMDQAGAQTKDG